MSLNLDSHMCILFKWRCSLFWYSLCGWNLGTLMCFSAVALTEILSVISDSDLAVGRAKLSHYCMVRQLHSFCPPVTHEDRGPSYCCARNSHPLRLPLITSLLESIEGLLHLCCLSDFRWCSGLGWEMGVTLLLLSSGQHFDCPLGCLLFHANRQREGGITLS